MTHPDGKPFIGCAGWSIPKAHAEHFPATGTHLERYAARFNGVEINSSFYRPHRFETYAKWSAAVPEEFRFAVKIPKSISHLARLKGVTDLLTAFLHEVSGLGPKLGPLLLQLPPSFAFDVPTLDSFFKDLREQHSGPVVCEPRHRSWSSAESSELLCQHRVGRVLADPMVVPKVELPGGWPGLTYFRLHGSPVIYYSSYPADYLAEVTANLRNASEGGSITWCIFDNTAEGAATTNALELLSLNSGEVS